VQVLYFEGIIIGSRQRMSCRVRALRTVTADNAFTDSGHAIIEDAAMGELPDGDYNMQIGGKRFTFKRRAGKFGLGQ
jgi:hypothetical protein